MIISLSDYAGDFAENKDVAAKLRDEYIRPTISQGDTITIDFLGVELTTQSFVHALISDVIRKNGEAILDRILFKSCSELVKELIQTVVQYSLESLDQ
jgi:hypothetical protein